MVGERGAGFSLLFAQPGRPGQAAEAALDAAAVVVLATWKKTQALVAFNEIADANGNRSRAISGEKCNGIHGRQFVSPFRAPPSRFSVEKATAVKVTLQKSGGRKNRTEFIKN